MHPCIEAISIGRHKRIATMPGIDIQHQDAGCRAGRYTDQAIIIPQPQFDQFEIGCGILKTVSRGWFFIPLTRKHGYTAHCQSERLVPNAQDGTPMSDTRDLARVTAV